MLRCYHATFVLARCFCCIIKFTCSFFHNFVESYFTLIGVIDDVTTGKRKLRHHFTCHQYKLKKPSQCECLQNLIPWLPTRHRTSYVGVRACVCVCVCVCVCMCARACAGMGGCVATKRKCKTNGKHKRHKRCLSIHNAKKTTTARACMRACVTIRRKVRAQGKLDKRHSVQESSSKHNAKKIRTTE